MKSTISTYVGKSSCFLASLIFALPVLAQDNDTNDPKTDCTPCAALRTTGLFIL